MRIFLRIISIGGAIYATIIHPDAYKLALAAYTLALSAII
jgi:hypothetical protein